MNNLTNKVKIKEIFASIQGEGIFVGVKQIFVRFCRCNLACKYCDTDFSSNYKEYSVDELVDYINTHYDKKSIHSISFTGGEPLLEVEFLSEFIKKTDLPVYLETNGTVIEGIDDVIKMADYISADIKLPSCSGLKNSFEKHSLFFEKVSQFDTQLFAKVVFDKNITDYEIEKTVELAKKYSFELILQPMMIGNKMSIDSDFIMEIFDKFLSKYNKVRLIPQVHKFLEVE